jgi:prepilin-type N-terminal cleavage/methylation domain-containing protein
MKPPLFNQESFRGHRGNSRRARGAFTLLELVIVVAIMGLIAMMGIPAIWGAMHRPPMSQAVTDILDTCTEARAQAILHNQTVSVRIYPHDRRIDREVVGSAPAPAAETAQTEEPPAKDGKAQGSAKTLSDRLAFDLLDVNFVECKDEEMATVRFFPNGTCDELTIVLHSDEGEYRKIKLDLVTAVAEVVPFP